MDMVVKVNVNLDIKMDVGMDADTDTDMDIFERKNVNIRYWIDGMSIL
jgi:hypothetical protein